MKIINILDDIKEYLYEGFPFQWEIWDNPIQMVSFADKEGYNGGSGNFWVDTTGEVLRVSVEVEINKKPYCYVWHNKNFRKKYVAHAKSINVNPNIAWDNVKYTKITTEKEILSIVKDMINVDYTRLPVIEIK